MDKPISSDDLPKIEDEMNKIIKSKSKIIKSYHSKKEALKVFDNLNEDFKAEIINDSDQEDNFQLYTQAETGFIDLCRGPHLPNIGICGEFKLTKVAGAYWRGDSNREQLQRIYGCAFLNKEQLKSHLNMLEEAAKRDHRKLGREMKLFHMQEEAPGQIFWHPNGWKIYTTLQDYMRRKQELDGYVEVNTPQLVDRKLWEASGH